MTDPETYIRIVESQNELLRNRIEELETARQILQSIIEVSEYENVFLTASEPPTKTTIPSGALSEEQYKILVEFLKDE